MYKLLAGFYGYTSTQNVVWHAQVLFKSLPFTESDQYLIKLIQRPLFLITSTAFSINVVRHAVVTGTQSLHDMVNKSLDCVNGIKILHGHHFQEFNVDF